MRVIGLDVHRNFAQVAILDGGLVRDHGRFVMEREAVLAFANKVLTKEDDVVLEATGNTAIIVRLLTPFVRRVVIANPLQVRAIAWAKVKTDKIDAATLARLHAAQFLPEVWMPPESVELQRRVIAERTQLVGQMTRLKNRIQSILHANLMPKETGHIFSKRGRSVLEALPLPADQMRMALRHHDELARLAIELAVIDRDLAQRALADADVKRLMTIGGVDANRRRQCVGCHRRHPTVLQPREAGQLPRIEPLCASVGGPSGVPRSHHSSRPRTCPRHAG